MVKLTNETVRTLPVKGGGTRCTRTVKRLASIFAFVRAARAPSSFSGARGNSNGAVRSARSASSRSTTPARKRARLLVGIDDGHDPVAAKAKSRADGKLIFETVAREYLDLKAKEMKPRSLYHCQRHLLKNLKPLHRLAIGKIDRATIAVELRTIAKSGPVQADRVRSTLSAMFGWCVGEGLLEQTP